MKSTSSKTVHEKDITSGLLTWWNDVQLQLQEKWKLKFTETAFLTYHVGENGKLDNTQLVTLWKNRYFHTPLVGVQMIQSWYHCGHYRGVCGKTMLRVLLLSAPVISLLTIPLENTFPEAQNICKSLLYSLRLYIPL